MTPTEYENAQRFIASDPFTVAIMFISTAERALAAHLACTSDSWQREKQYLLAKGCLKIGNAWLAQSAFDSVSEIWLAKGEAAARAHAETVFFAKANPLK